MRVAHLEVRLVRHPPEPAAREVHRRHDDERRRARAATSTSSKITTAPTNRKMFCTNSTRPCEIELLHRVDVGGHARDDPAGLLGLEVVERERHQVPEQPVAQVAQEALTDPRDEDDREPAEHEAERTRATRYTHDREVRARRASSLADAVVDAVPHQQRAGRATRRPAPSARTSRPTIAPRCGRSMRAAGAGPARASSRDSVSSGTLSPQNPPIRRVTARRRRRQLGRRPSTLARCSRPRRAASTSRYSALDVASRPSWVPSAIDLAAVDQHDAIGERDRRRAGGR